jgi:radical SAM protein with 4Fe4S-binding SPASM domain
MMGSKGVGLIAMREQFHIQWHITNSCNLRCQHCYQDDFSNDRDLDWAGLEIISQNIQETMEGWNKVACINLTGGEPLLKPEVFPLLGYLDQKTAVEELGLITNGLCLDREIMERLSQFSKLRKIKLSLDGPDAETNDSLRRKGSFENVLETLSMLRQEKRFEIILMFTVMKRNYKSLSSYLHLFHEWGADGVILERFIPWGRGRERAEDVLGKKEWIDVARMLSDFFSDEVAAEALFPFQAFHVRGGADGMELLGAPCVVGVDGLCIMPEGTVFPCRRFPVSIGNLLSDPLHRIWETSALLATLRRKENLRGRCGVCEIKECRGCRSLALSLTGDYLAEDPHCWYPSQAFHPGHRNEAELPIEK